jgi:hypothetical protein
LEQSASELYSVMAQQLMLDIVINSGEGQVIDIQALKLAAPEYAEKVTDDVKYTEILEELRGKSLVEIKR